MQFAPRSPHWKVPEPSPHLLSIIWPILGPSYYSTVPVSGASTVPFHWLGFLQVTCEQLKPVAKQEELPWHRRELEKSPAVCCESDDCPWWVGRRAMRSGTACRASSLGSRESPRASPSKHCFLGHREPSSHTWEFGGDASCCCCGMDGVTVASDASITKGGAP